MGYLHYLEIIEINFEIFTMVVPRGAKVHPRPTFPSPPPLNNQCLKHLPLGEGKIVLSNVMSRKPHQVLTLHAKIVESFGWILSLLSLWLFHEMVGNSLLGVCFAHRMFLATLHSSKVIALGFYP
jgi:hypothetical protein